MLEAIHVRKLLGDNASHINVAMQEFATTSGYDEHPILKTIGVGSCVCVVMYHPENQAGSLAHLSCMDDPLTGTNPIREALQGMLGSLRKAGFIKNSTQLQIHVLGGYTEGMGHQEVLDTLKRMGLPQPVTSEYSPPEGSLSLVLDTRTGEVTDLEAPFFFREMSDSDRRLEMLESLLPHVHYSEDPRVVSYKVLSRAKSFHYYKVV